MSIGLVFRTVSGPQVVHSNTGINVDIHQNKDVTIIEKALQNYLATNTLKDTDESHMCSLYQKMVTRFFLTSKLNHNRHMYVHTISFSFQTSQDLSLFSLSLASGR